MRRAHLAWHRRAWLALAVVLPAILFSALTHRAPTPVERPVERLDAPAQP